MARKGQQNIQPEIDTKAIEAVIVVNLIKIQLFIILSYEDLTTTHRGSCADDLYRLPIKLQLTRFRKWKALKVACMEYFDWLIMNSHEMEITKVVCTWPPMGCCQIFIC